MGTTNKKFENMFDGASRFDGKIFAGTGVATTMDSMFKGASSFTGKNAENMETQACLDMDSLFQSASAFNAAIVTDGNKWNVAAVDSFIVSFDQNKNIILLTGFFSGCRICSK